MSTVVTVVSPRGCSRAFIIRTLYLALAYVTDQATRNVPVSFPFPHDIILLWLETAREECLFIDELQEAVGGTIFNYSDPETFWRQPIQFLTWWKNNVERKTKFQGLIRDADSSKPGINTNRSKRSFYCRIAVALANNIRNHFSKHITENGGLVQVNIPTLQNTHPSQERIHMPINATAIKKKHKKVTIDHPQQKNSIENNTLEGLDLLSHTISSRNTFNEGNSVLIRSPISALDDGMNIGSINEEAESEMDASDVLGMGGLLSLRAYIPDTAAVTFCENIYNRSIPPGSKESTNEDTNNPSENPNIYRISPEELKNTTLKDHGFNIFQKDPNSPVIIYGVIDGSPAYEYGLRNGCIITHIDGVNVTGKSYDDVLSILQSDRLQQQQLQHISTPRNSAVIASSDSSDFLSLQDDYYNMDTGSSSIVMLEDEEALVRENTNLTEIVPLYARIHWQRGDYEDASMRRKYVCMGGGGEWPSDGITSKRRAVDSDEFVIIGEHYETEESITAQDALSQRTASSLDMMSSGVVEESIEEEDEAEIGEASKVSKKRKMSSSVTSLGCCRAFITSVLARALDHVQKQRNIKAISFPFPAKDISEWLKLAADDCHRNKDLQLALGGTQFSANDQSTYWTAPSQFLTWWKNNIERKSKFNSLKKDAASCTVGDVSSRAKRALYCRMAVAFATNIRNHLDRVVADNKGLFQVPVPTVNDTHPQSIIERYNAINNQDELINDSISGAVRMVDVVNESPSDVITSSINNDMVNISDNSLNHEEDSMLVKLSEEEEGGGFFSEDPYKEDFKEVLYQYSLDDDPVGTSAEFQSPSM